MIRIAILGSTGSIGRSALEVIHRHPGQFKVVSLVAETSADALAAQVASFNPRLAVLADEKVPLPDGDGMTTWASGSGAVLEAAADPDTDVVLNALVGAAGLEPTLTALEAGHRLALANKESLVAGGHLVLSAAERGSGEIVPIDSEHSAILQCLQGYGPSDVQRLMLTASGGPFRGREQETLWDVGPEDALKHPTWSMGAKITIDSATLANKALEIIEAHFLYGIAYERLDAIVHPQSVIHSLVEFVDGSVLAQLGFPTMELPILYALTYPNRMEDVALQAYDPLRSSPLTFEPIDDAAFPLFEVGVRAGRTGECAPAVYNAANEIAVQAFLESTIRFPEMADLVSGTIDQIGNSAVTGVEDVLESDRSARSVATEVAHSLSKTRVGVTR